MTALLSSWFLSELANHMWQTTIFVGIVAVITRAMRGNRACVRHAMWLAASVKFALPFSLLVAVGSAIEWPRTTLALPSTPNFFEITRIVAEPVAVSAANPGPGILTWIAGSVWLTGFTIILLRWCYAWRRSHRKVRSATRWHEPVPGWADVRVSVEAEGPAVFGLVRPVLLLPARIDEQLTSEDLSAVIAHERAHVRRYDNLTTAFHRIVTAVFWFHPFVWWIGKRLIEERERASDEAAVADGFSPRVYAEVLLKVGRSALGTQRACAAGVYGFNLKTRIEGIMKYEQVRNLHPLLRLGIAAFLLLSLSGPVAGGLFGPSPPGSAGFLQPAIQEPAPEEPQVPSDEERRAFERLETEEERQQFIESFWLGRDPTPGTFERWLDQDAVYIIQDEERTAFEDLRTDEEREQFIESFWLRRDPTPGTITNEYREEHYRRISEANLRFSFGGTQGWQSDRGRIYIVYGEPESVESGVSGAGQPASIALERWGYAYIEGLGENAELTFVDVNRTGVYVLQTPATNVEAPIEQAADSLSELELRVELVQIPEAPVEQAADAVVVPDTVETASQSAPILYRVGGGVSEPKILESVQPRFPPEARGPGAGGTVEMEAVVRQDGSVEVQSIISSESSAFAEAAVAAIEQWRFSPGMRDGEPVDVVMDVVVTFNSRN